ncbi:hypothetical protein KVV02_000053 [Mortierella alpina]|uniref:Phosphatidylglycerol/phosphatidylinositol transfer protein n=1 Tax=Mortierella alpina TaxID=64518 RepID=A0A9P8CWC3_MORAP|nr:hypothetical protein KVV02_000053 [Mortierella alpina]
MRAALHPTHFVCCAFVHIMLSCLRYACNMAMPRSHLSLTNISRFFLSFILSSSLRLGVIKLLTRELDFCKESATINKTCPLVAGEQSLYHSVELPKEIPPGKYLVNIKVVNPDDKQVTCLVARAQFGIK